MLKKDDFISFILDGQKQSIKKSPAAVPAPTASDLMSLGFDIPATSTETTADESSFAQKLLEASDFGKPEYVQTASLIRSTDSVAQHLPPRAAYWPKTPSRPYQTLLFETDKSHRDLLAIPAFKSRKMSHLDMVEDALARMVSEALEGFQRGGDSVTADVRKGKKEETLCIMSVKDERELQQVRLVCFGTVNAKSNGLETFHLTEQTRYWDQQLAKDHLGLLYERQFKKLGTANWQEAFTTSEERKQAEKLLEVCSKKSPQKTEIEENVINLLDTIAKNFGLRCKAGQTRRLQAFNLPSDHDIGIDPENISKHGGKNPFGGVTLRDEKNRLLGYIVYPLKKKEDAAELRSYLEKNNRFHNVLVVFPDGDETTLELWQGIDQLSGKLRKDHGFHGAAEVVSLLSRFFVVSKAKVRNPSELAQELAYRARYLRRLAIKELEVEKQEGPIRNLYKAFKEALVHDQTESEFADAFAQTLTYGLLTARWIGNDKLSESGERFTRQNSLKYLPATSNFLGDLFKTALAVKLDDQRGRLLWLVDDIADLLDRIDVTYVFGIGDKDSDQATDPVIHFYEPFLAAYDNELRNKRGVYFTPRPVVSYIVLSVHELLQTEFGLVDGLASDETWGDVQKRFHELKLPSGVKATDPFICILDPATGTGTFLYECIEVIERTMKEKWCKDLGIEDWTDHAILSRWREYVSNNLLQRLYGFELMMASYSIAHLKLAFKLGETGYRIKDGERLHIYLTNSLEKSSQNQRDLIGIMPALARESLEVNEVKNHKRFTVVVGNPPYAGHSSNTGEWISELVRDYYFVDGKPLGEKNPKWLQDDYVKFIRLGQDAVSTSGTGVHSFITNHGYIDNPTFRGMRQCLINSFDKIDIIDLHGNSTKKEQCPDGSEDKNVFDIKQGVAIFTSRRLPGNKNKSTLINHTHLYGTRDYKYNKLIDESLHSISKIQIYPTCPFYAFVPQDADVKFEYEQFIHITKAMPINVLGFQTHRDNFAVDFDRSELEERISEFRNNRLTDAKIKELYDISDNRDWNVNEARNILRNTAHWRKPIISCSYRLFDDRPCYFSTIAMDYPRRELLDHVAGKENICLGLGRQGIAVQDPIWSLVWISKKPVDANIFRRGGINLFPLYLYPETGGLGLHKETRLNFSPGFLKSLSAQLATKQDSKNGCPKGISPELIIYYTYGIFHSLNYRKRYADFLKNDFPRLPLPSTAQFFKEVAQIGQKIAETHLLESSTVNKSISTYIGASDPEVKRISWSDGSVWIDAPPSAKNKPSKAGTSGFQGVSEQIWNFSIGGFQVCEKWLKDRKGRTLSDDDIAHYQKIIVAISETIRLMEEIDKVIDEHGGWPGAFQSSSGANA